METKRENSQPRSLESLLEDVLKTDEALMVAPTSVIDLMEGLEVLVNRSVHIVGVIARERSESRCSMHILAAAETLIADASCRLAVLDFAENDRSFRPAFAVEHADNALSAVLNAGASIDSNYVLKQLIRTLMLLLELPVSDSILHSRVKDLLGSSLKLQKARQDEIEPLMKKALAELNSGLLLESFSEEFDDPSDRKVFLKRASELIEEANSKFEKAGSWFGAGAALNSTLRIGKTAEQLDFELSKEKPLKICAVCGTPLREDAKFCGACGAMRTVEAFPEVAAPRCCSGCGAQLKPTSRFCPKCGKQQSH